MGNKNCLEVLEKGVLPLPEFEFRSLVAILTPPPRLAERSTRDLFKATNKPRLSRVLGDRPTNSETQYVTSHSIPTVFGQESKPGSPDHEGDLTICLNHLVYILRW